LQGIYVKARGSETMSGALIAMGLILAWISTCLVDAPLSVIALVGGTGVALMVGGYITKKKGEWPDGQ
jgi:hypothetical protein